jgi:hypothetical protein
MAKKKLSGLKVTVLGTGINSTFLCRSHEIVPYPASTYHRFIHMDGSEELKNDFGVSSVIKIAVDIEADEQ